METLDELSAVFSKTSAIAFAILDDQLRFRFVNDALVVMHNSIPAQEFVGCRIPDVIGAAGVEPEARLRRVSVTGETPAREVTLRLPSRTGLGYWIEKNFPFTGKSGTVIQIVSVGIEVTGTRKLEEYFRQLAGELLWSREKCQRFARELHNGIGEYHAALGMNLDSVGRCARHPDKIPELLKQSGELTDLHARKLECVIARCFPVDRLQ